MRNLQISQVITSRESRSTETYFSEIGKEELITAGEEVLLARKIRAGDQQALDRLTRTNLRFVVSVAKKYQYQGLALNDLIMEGNLGLIKAAKRFDETRGFKFISFAVWWIRQSIIAAIRENARMVRLPLNKINEISRINKALAALEQKTQREPTAEQVAEYLGTTACRVTDALFAAPWTTSLDATYGDQDGYSLVDRLPSMDKTTDHVMIAADLAMEFSHMLAVLSAKERMIIELTYGITGDPGMSPSAIAKRINLPQETIRQIRNRALDKLRCAATGNRINK